ncbi:sugar ABC transporter permease [Amylibacter sp.]|jgi:alpha-glucoside transport system permease protein|nr:sugar ABC transporter permease [Rhodobacterales bacterium]MDA7739886.1 sugar ABC transporter permease [Amylibacter sp.]MBT4134213.1 sugar ABC transporter permease [Rhodobacterales bacterium]MBT4323852.1 sugar ABC transporter permease [Rhodobacterales bacterium]MBT4470533.1 sugar ABC transporter permease [Rhodobacterales bacterium]|tara:strand:- start:849 stop:2102 length:1254 start_codon:yes stop_codon:yes gene_type:complete
MRSLKPVIASNGFAILLTVVFLLPIMAIFLFVVTTPIDSILAKFGLWLHGINEWSFPEFDTEERFSKIGFAIRSVLIAVGISFLYFWLTNWLNMNLAVYREKKSIGRQSNIVEAIQPWIFVGPTLVLLLLFLMVPALSTLSLSFQESDGTLSSRNYAFLWDSSALGYLQFRLAMRNSLMWLILVPSLCIVLGLLIAVLADSVRWGVVAKTFIFVPLAISFVGAAVIWRNIFAGGGIEALETINGSTPSYQIGLLKSLLGHTAEYNEPLYSLKFWGNFFLMWILVWVQTGFAMVIFSAALRGVPEDTIEAATIDGANPFQMFFRIKLPQIYSTVLVVWTTLVILVLKVFDIPYALSANDDDKLLLATMMENARNNWSIGGDNVDNLYAAIAVMLMLTVVPNMVFNGWRIRREQKELGN